MTVSGEPAGAPSWASFSRDFAEAVRRRRAALFVGAGVSFGAGLPDWGKLVWELVADAKLELERDDALPLPNVAQYYVNSHGDEAKLRGAIGCALEGGAPTDTHRALRALGVDLLWTSNYDQLIEQEYGERIDVRAVGTDFARESVRGEATLFKLHGTLRDPPTAEDGKLVITRRDYARYRTDREEMYVALLNDLLRRRFLFVGFSFDDPNVMGVLDAAARLSGDGPPRHFAVFLRAKWDNPVGRVRLQDLALLGVEALMVEDWDELPGHLDLVRHRLTANRVLVSGSAGSHPTPQRMSKLEKFSERLGRMLIERDFTMVCGLNPAVGRAAVDGALDSLHERGETTELQRARPAVAASAGTRARVDGPQDAARCVPRADDVALGSRGLRRGRRGNSEGVRDAPRGRRRALPCGGHRRGGRRVLGHG
jgi:hypothetical protein